MHGFYEKDSMHKITMAQKQIKTEVRIPVVVEGEKTIYVVDDQDVLLPGKLIVKKIQQAQELYVNGQIQVNPDYDERAHRQLNIDRINQTYQPTFMDYEKLAKEEVNKYFTIDNNTESLANYVAEVKRVRDRLIKEDEVKHPFVVKKKKERKTKNSVVWQVNHFPLSLMQNSLSTAQCKEIEFRKKYVKIFDVFNMICNFDLNKEGIAMIQGQYSKYVKTKPITFKEVYDFIIEMIDSELYLSENRILPQYEGEMEIGIGKPNGPHMDDIVTDTPNMDVAWEKALQSHYNHNSHHPENSLFQSPDQSERQKIIRTVEIMLDLWVSALRVKTNTIEALKMSLTWFVDPETGKIREKFSKTRLLGFMIYAYKLYSCGVKNFEIFSHQNSSKLRQGPLSKQAFECDWLTVLRNCSKTKTWSYIRSIPEIQSMISETRLHIQHVTYLLRSFRLCSDKYLHDKDKMYKQMLIVYTWKWYVNPKILKTAKPTFFNMDSVNSTLKSSINDAVDSLKSEVDFAKMNETVDLGGQVFTKMLGMSATVDSIFDNINQILEPFKEFSQFLGQTIDKPKVLAMVGLVIMWRNVDSMSLRALILAAGLKILGCYEPVFRALRYIIENYIIDPITKVGTKFMGFFTQASQGPQPTSGIMDNIYDLFFQLIDKVSNLDPTYCAYAMGAIAMLLGVASLTAKDLLTAGTAFVSYMRASYYIGSGLNGIQRIFVVMKELTSATIDWVREKLGKETSKKVEAEFAQWYQSVEVLCIKTNLSIIPQSKRIVEQAKTIVEQFYEYRRLLIEGKLPRHLHHILNDASRQLRPVISILTRLNDKQIFRAAPYHLQFYGKSGIGKSRLARTIFERLRTTFYPDHTGQISYPRNPVTKHWDGYQKSMKFLFYDEATPIDDPSIASEMLLVISPVACIVPMADLVDKPTQVEVDFVLSNTNSKYPNIKGVICMDAIWRRRNLITVECDPKVMQNGVFDSVLFEKHYNGQNSEEYPHLKFIWEPAIENIGIVDTGKVKNLIKREMNFTEFMIYLQTDFAYHKSNEINKGVDQKTIDQLYEALNKLKNLNTKFTFSMFEDNEIPPPTTEVPEEEEQQEEQEPQYEVPDITKLIDNLYNIDLNSDECNVWQTVEPIQDLYIKMLKGEAGNFTTQQFDNYCTLLKDKCLRLSDVLDGDEFFPYNNLLLEDYIHELRKDIKKARKMKDGTEKKELLSAITLQYFLARILEPRKFNIRLWRDLLRLQGINVPLPTAIQGESYIPDHYVDSRTKEILKSETAILAKYQQLYDLSLECLKQKRNDLFYILQAFCRYNVHRGDFHDVYLLSKESLASLIEFEIIPTDELELSSLFKLHVLYKLSRNYSVIQANIDILLNGFTEHLDVINKCNISELLKEIHEMVDELIAKEDYEHQNGPMDAKKRAHFRQAHQTKSTMSFKNEVKFGKFYFRACHIPKICYWNELYNEYTSDQFLERVKYEPQQFQFKPGMKFKDDRLQSAVDALNEETCIISGIDPRIHILDVYTLTGIKISPLGVPFYKTPEEYCKTEFKQTLRGIVRSEDYFIARTSTQRTFETIWKYEVEDLITLRDEAIKQATIGTKIHSFWSTFKETVYKFDFKDAKRWFWYGVDIMEEIWKQYKHVVVVVLASWAICKTLDGIARCILGPSETSYKEKGLKTGKTFRFTEEPLPTADSSHLHAERIEGMRKMITPIKVHNVTANAIRIESKIIAVPYHLISQYIYHGKDFQIQIRPTTDSEDTWLLNIKPSDVYRYEHSDTAFICSENLPTSQKFTGNFYSESELGREKHENMYVPYFKNDSYKLVVHKFLKMEHNRLTTFNNIDYKYPTLFCYSGMSEVGSSGAPVVNISQNEKSCILGLQSFTYNGDSFCSLITKEIIQEAIQHFENKKKDFKIKMTSYVDEVENISTLTFDNPHLKVVEHMEDRILGGTGKTNFRETFFYDRVPTTRIPALLNISDPRCRGLNPANDSVNKYGRDPIKSPQQHLIDQAVKDIYMYFKEQGLKQCKVLTEEEAICSYRSAPHINLSTSPGYPWCLMRYAMKGKTRWLRINESGELEYYSPVLQKAVKDTTYELNNGVFPNIYAVDYLKDELRPPHKVFGMTEEQYSKIDIDNISTWPKTNPKTRTITVSPLETTIIYRQDHLDLYTQLQELARKNLIPYAVGINPDSPVAFKIYNDMKMFNYEGVDFDVKNWDGHFPSWLMKAVCDFESCCYDDELRNKRAYVLNMGLMSIPIIHDNIIYTRMMGLISGNPGTTDKNTMGHVLLGYIMFLDIMERKKMYNYMNIRVYFSTVIDKYYGDDRLTVIHKNFSEYFTPQMIKEWYEEHGWPVSTAKKTEKDEFLRPIEDLTFLKRRFEVDEQDPYYVKWKMEEETIWNLLTYIRKNNQPRAQLMQNICSAQEFIALHGKTKYDQFVSIVNSILAERRYPLILESFEEMRRTLRNRYYEDQVLVR